MVGENPKEKKKKERTHSSHLFIYNLANICVDSFEEIIHGLCGLPGKVKLAVNLRRLVHIAKRDVEHVVAPLVAEKCLVHL